MKIANRANTNRARIPGPRSDQWFGFALVLPALIVLLVVIALPILKGIYVSFFSYKLKDISQPLFDFSSANIQKILAGEEGLGALSNLKWNDLANYTSLFKRGEILDYFGNTILFVLLTVSIQLVLGMIIALLLNSKLRATGFFRGVMLIPWTIPSNSLAMASVVIASVWRQLPYMMVMLLAALQSVDSSLEEAAHIDGANGWQSFSHVVLPSIRPVLITSTWIAVMNNFQSYTIIANMNGTGAATMTLSIAAYQEAFKSYNFGKGAAIGVMWLVLLFVITLISNRASDRATNDYQ